MAWIELHQSVWTHKKTLIMASLLGIKSTYAAAHMIHFWTWALDNAQDGDITGLPSKVIAIGADWDGDPDLFVKSAIQAGWLDSEDNKLYIHDWMDYAGKLLERRIADRERKRRSSSSTQKNSNGNPTEIQRNSHVPNLTLPNLTIYNNIPSSGDEGNEIDESKKQQMAEECTETVPNVAQTAGKAKTKRNNYTAEFEEFWRIYPRKIEKMSAFQAWKVRLKEGISVDDMIKAAINYSHYCEERHTETQYIKHASTFLGSQKPFIDFINKIPEEKGGQDYGTNKEYPSDAIQRVCGSDYEPNSGFKKFKL